MESGEMKQFCIAEIVHFLQYYQEDSDLMCLVLIKICRIGKH